MPKRVFWSCPPDRTVTDKQFVHFLRLAEEAGRREFIYIPQFRKRTDIARDDIVAEFLRLSSDPEDTLVMLDADHWHPHNVIERLASACKPIVTALAFKSNPEEPLPCMWLRDENGLLSVPRTWPRDSLFQVAIGGAGAIAIQRQVFLKFIKHGWDRMFFFYEYLPDGTRTSDEVGLYSMAEQLGIPAFVDTGIVTPHCVEGVVDETSYLDWSKDHPVAEPKTHKISIIIPQRGRIEQLKQTLQSLYESGALGEHEAVLVVDDDDSDSKNLYLLHPHIYRVIVDPGLTPVEKWNEGAQWVNGDVLMLGANDIVFDKDWLKHALSALRTLPDEQGVVGTNDGYTNGEASSPHFLATREFLVQHNGGVLCVPHYHAAFPDVEICEKARELGLYRFAKASRVIHKHPQTNSAPVDEIHERGFLRWYDTDRLVWLERQAKGYPIDFEPVLK